MSAALAEYLRLAAGREVRRLQLRREDDEAGWRVVALMERLWFTFSSDDRARVNTWMQVQIDRRDRAREERRAREREAEREAESRDRLLVALLAQRQHAERLVSSWLGGRQLSDGDRQQLARLLEGRPSEGIGPWSARELHAMLRAVGVELPDLALR